MDSLPDVRIFACAGGTRAQKSLDANQSRRISFDSLAFFPVRRSLRFVPNAKVQIEVVDNFLGQVEVVEIGLQICKRDRTHPNP